MSRGTVTELLADRVRKLRAELGWSAQRLADECARAGFDSLTRGTIAKIESGVRQSVTADEVTALARVLGVTPNDLLAPPDWWQPRAPQLRTAGAATVDPPLPREELERLQELLAAVHHPDVPALARRAVGTNEAPVRPGTDVWTGFEQLMDVSAEAGELPPALKFLDLVAEHIAEPLRADLLDWVEQVAEALHVRAQLRAWRTERSAGPPELRLVFVVQPDEIDPNRFLLSYWRQDDPEEWPPPQGETIEVTPDELESRVDEIVVAAEWVWAAHPGTVTLEFVLPRSLLDLPVHRWQKERQSGLPRPLALDYPIVMRSLERMTSVHWHRIWRERWRSMLDDPSPARVHFAGPADVLDSGRLQAILNNPRWTAVVLSRAPQPEPRSGPDELTAALRAGIPVLIWHPLALPEQLRDIVSWLVQGDGVADIAKRLRAARFAEYQESSVPFDPKLALDLVVLWDDPTRTLTLDQPPVRPE
jgi:transcriptional regulator with XRE-family HTH domain